MFGSGSGSGSTFGTGGMFGNSGMSQESMSIPESLLEEAKEERPRKRMASRPWKRMASRSAKRVKKTAPVSSATDDCKQLQGQGGTCEPSIGGCFVGEARSGNVNEHSQTLCCSTKTAGSIGNRGMFG